MRTSSTASPLNATSISAKRSSCRVSSRSWQHRTHCADGQTRDRLRGGHPDLLALGPARVGQDRLQAIDLARLESSQRHSVAEHAELSDSQRRSTGGEVVEKVEWHRLGRQKGEKMAEQCPAVEQLVVAPEPIGNRSARRSQRVGGDLRRRGPHDARDRELCR